MTLSKSDYFRYLFNIYFLKRGTITKSWSSPSCLSEDSFEQGPVKWAYPLDFSQDIHENLLTDEAGVPMIDYANLGTHYNPWFVGHIALGYYNLWKRDQKQTNIEHFKTLADWFVDQQVETEHGVTWMYYFDYFGGQKKPWKSGLSQAHGISVLLRAASIFDKNKYESTARKALNELTTPYTQGGPAYFREDGTVSFEEYFADPPYSVLNGHLFATISCWEASLYFKEKKAEQITEAAFNFVKKYLPDYDLGFWSTYSLKTIAGRSDISSFHYHDVHIAQLKSAYRITGAPVFQTYANKFQEYQNDKYQKSKAFMYKSFVKIMS